MLIQNTTSVNGAQISYEICGSGPAIVLIHGFSLDRRMWDMQMPALTAQFTVLRYDLRGFGSSSLPDTTPYSHCADLKALLDHLGIAHAHICGLSLGGAIAIDFALSCPEYVERLVLVDVSAVSGYPMTETIGAQFTAIKSLAKSGDMLAAKQQWQAMQWFVPARKQDSVAVQLDRMIADYSGWHFCHDNPVLPLTPAAMERLKDIIAPTLIVIGEYDLADYNQPLARRLHEGVKDSQTMTMPGVGHMANMEAPEMFNAALLAFLSETAF